MAKLSTHLVSVKRITTTCPLNAEGKAIAEKLSHMMETAEGTVQPLILVNKGERPGEEFTLGVAAEQQYIVLEAARILRERNPRKGEMVQAYIVDHPQGAPEVYLEILEMAKLLYPGAQVVCRLTDYSHIYD